MSNIEKYRSQLFEELDSLDEKIKEVKLNRKKPDEVPKFKWTFTSVFYVVKSYFVRNK